MVFAIVSVRVVRHKQKKQFIRTLSLHDVKTVHRVTPEDQLICNAVEVLGAENPKFTSLGSLIDTLGITLFGKENLEFDQNLGEGAFGKVYRPQLHYGDNELYFFLIFWVAMELPLNGTFNNIDRATYITITSLKLG